MIKNKIFFCLMILLINKNIIAQDVVPSVSNILRYGDGERIFGSIKLKHRYFENLTDVRLSLLQSFTVGFRLLYDDPPEVGETFRGISRRFIEFNKDDIYLRAGNSSALFGRGLALNLFEDRGLAYDTWMDGVKFKYSPEFFNVSLLGGTIDFRDSVNIVRHETYKIRGGSFEVPLDEILFGFTYIYAEGNIPQGEVTSAIPPKNIKAEIPEFYFSLNLDELSLYLDWSRKWVNVTEDKTTSTGWGLYGAVSYLGDGFGITLDYKNYSFDILDPYGRYDLSRATRMLPFQNPPIVQKEHSYTLLTRALHEVDFNDEVGFQVDAFYSLDENTTLNFNTGFSSIHNRYQLNKDGFTFSEIVRDGNFIPTFEKEFFPYYELFIEGEHYYDISSAIRLAAAFREKTFFNEFSLDKSSIVTNSFVIPLQVQHVFSENYSLTFQSEHEWVSETFNQTEDKFFNHLITIINSFYSTLTASIRYEYTTSNNDVSGRRNWISGELGYRLMQSHVITLSFGIERGGLICSNGVCRYIQPFEGFRLNILSQI
ncbi:MAG: hypothetical protein A2080_12830 [Ignavibacteria bacterium GWC2_36_12]|nr:MAG: hypothetical protein A2080_12830 [Ignavibacteria bacterium GWC2_36_12]